MRLGVRVRVPGQEAWSPVQQGVPAFERAIAEAGTTTKLLVGAGRAVKERTMEALESMTLGELLYMALFGEGVSAA